MLDKVISLLFSIRVNPIQSLMNKDSKIFFSGQRAILDVFYSLMQLEFGSFIFIEA